MSIPEFKTPTPDETDAILRDARALRAEFISNAVKRLVVHKLPDEFRFPMGKPSELWLPFARRRIGDAA